MSANQKDSAALWGAYNAALKTIVSAGAQKGSGGYEKRFADAYQALVRAGLAQQIRGKYRG